MRPPYIPPKVIRQEVLWIPQDRKVEVKEYPYRVWTLYSFCAKNVKPELPITPVHHHGAFLEDHVHDWNIDITGGKMKLRYYSRAIESNVWVLLEFTDPKDNPYTRKPGRRE